MFLQHGNARIGAKGSRATIGYYTRRAGEGWRNGDDRVIILALALEWCGPPLEALQRASGAVRPSSLAACFDEATCAHTAAAVVSQFHQR